MTENDEMIQVLDVSINRLCWSLACPFICGHCPYETGKFSCHTSRHSLCFPLRLTVHSSVLFLRDNDVERYDRSICGARTSTRPYENVGRVEISNCFCLVCVDSELGTIMPGWGCDRNTADRVVKELRGRQQQGKINQLSRQILERSTSIERKMEILSMTITDR